MSGRRDYYQVLGVPRDADARALKQAFRQLARRYHPDTSTDPDAGQRFREIAEAYGVLSDPARRASYDAGGLAGLAGASAEDLWGGIDFTGIFGPGVPGFGGLFERLFGQPEGPPRGEDLRVDLALSLDQLMGGGEQEVAIPRPGPCPACQGRGQVIGQPCPACHGTGQAVQQETVTVRIPGGIPDRTALRLAGRGMPSPVPGGPPGDAYVIIRTLPDPRFARDGADLWHTLHIAVADAVLGTVAMVPAPGGQARVRVPPGTPSGAVLAIEGKGLPRYRGHGYGRLDVTVIADIPQRLSPRQRRLYEQLRAEEAPAAKTPASPRGGTRTEDGHVPRRHWLSIAGPARRRAARRSPGQAPARSS